MSKPWLKSYPSGVPEEVDLSEYSSVADIVDSSIAKWKFISKYLVDAEKVPFDGQAVTCGLCSAFGNCSLCPVQKSTGENSCEGTPYTDYYDAWRQNNIEGALTVAIAEMNYLKSLKVKLEKEELTPDPLQKALDAVDACRLFDADNKEVLRIVNELYEEATE